MANQQHLDLLKQGVIVWNAWREKHPEIHPDLSEANLYEANLSRANLSEATLGGANLSKSNLRDSDLRGASLIRADLSEANLLYALLDRTDLRETSLIGCHVYGISAWDVNLDQAIQRNLVITRDTEPTITVDNLEVAQFIYLLLNNKKIRNAIDCLTSKVILVMGRFTPERKAVLDAIRDKLRKLNYLPILFDFEKPASRNISETFITLASLSRFIIADITKPSSVIQELQSIVPTLAIPVQPVMEESGTANSMFLDFKSYPWVLPVYRYKDTQQLLTSLEKNVVAPAEAKARELEGIKMQWTT